MKHFNGSYSFLKKVLQKFNIYDCRASVIGRYYGYNYLINNCEEKGVNKRFWHLLHLDLSILNAINPEIKYINLEELKKELTTKLQIDKNVIK